MSPRQKSILAIAGPTGSGKSALALTIAEALDGEIVNYDSVQLYRHLDIGTAKPSLAERRRVRHHLIDVLEPQEHSSAGEYQRFARRKLAEISARGKLPVLAGGTGLYLRAVLDGLFDGPERSAYWRPRLKIRAEERGPEHLHRILTRVDPAASRRIASRDTPKIVRALEVRFQTGRSLSEHLRDSPRRRLEGFSFLIVGLNPDRDSLYRVIDARVSEMFERGLVDEVRRLLASGIPPQAEAFRAIGYRQVLEYIAGAASLEEAIMSTGRDTRRYAKRQMTWFRKQHRIAWFDGFGSDAEFQGRVRQFLNHNF